MSYRKTIGSAMAAILILILSQLSAILLVTLIALTKIPAWVCNVLSGFLYLGLAAVLVKLFSSKFLKIRLCELGMPKPSVKLRWAIAAVLLPASVKAVYLAFCSGRFVSSHMSHSKLLTTLSTGIFFTGIASGFVEEMIFRGIIFRLIKDKWNTAAAILVPSFLFGLVHILGSGYSLSDSLLVVTAGTMVGIMFSVIAIEGGSVWNSGIVHAMWNIVIIGGGLSIADKPDKFSAMTYVLSSKSFALTGGEFGIESSLISVIAYTAVSAAAIFLILKKNNSSHERRTP